MFRLGREVRVDELFSLLTRRTHKSFPIYASSFICKNLPSRLLDIYEFCFSLNSDDAHAWFNYILPHRIAMLTGVSLLWVIKSHPLNVSSDGWIVGQHGNSSNVLTQTPTRRWDLHRKSSCERLAPRSIVKRRGDWRLFVSERKREAERIILKCRTCDKKRSARAIELSNGRNSEFIMFEVTESSVATFINRCCRNYVISRLITLKLRAESLDDRKKATRRCFVGSLIKSRQFATFCVRCVKTRSVGIEKKGANFIHRRRQQ